jgi:integrase
MIRESSKSESKTVAKDAERVRRRELEESWNQIKKRTLPPTFERAGLQLRFHDLRHTCITKLAESQASEQTLMAIAGHVSRKMIEHYSHIRMEAKRDALDAIAKPGFGAGVAQNWAQSPDKQKSTVAKSLN